MALPTLNVPKFKMKLPSDGRTVNYRPFLVKEEKLLLLATETGSQEDIVTAIKNIITECTDIHDIDDLPTFDIEFVFLQIRTKSVGEAVEVSVTCPDDSETTVPVKIPLNEIKVKKDKKHKKDIKLGDDIILTMGYPSLDTFVQMNFQEEEPTVDSVFEMAASCVKQIADAEQVYDAMDTPKEELISFFDQLTSQQFQEVQAFFDTMPKLQHTVKVINPKTKVESSVTLEGLSAFFA
ncbi:MAG: baseplate protein [Alphaproteobacteria bacterium]|nr:baseplate protein [Alphaproteobacteria bacterium]|tara:strand:- start:3739 stop:4449 length:711 start_codon:yes stop_codon:yes gene_type:complete